MKNIFVAFLFLVSFDSFADIAYDCEFDSYSSMDSQKRQTDDNLVVQFFLEKEDDGGTDVTAFWGKHRRPAKVIFVFNEVDNAMNFMEISDIGIVTLTTIMIKTGESVNSRHLISMEGKPMFKQMYGKCKLQKVFSG